MVILLIRRSKQHWVYNTTNIGDILCYRDTIDKAAKAIEWWSNTFNLSYEEFRLEIRKIASKLHVGFDHIIQWSDQETVKRLPPGTILLPIDEDDWLIPATVPELRRLLDKPIDIILWETIFKEVNGNTTRNAHQHNYIESCGYAVKLPFEWSGINNHMYLGKSKKTKTLTIPKVLSVCNRTPASLTFLYRQPIDSIIPTIQAAINKVNDLPNELNKAAEDYRSLLMELLKSIK